MAYDSAVTSDVPQLLNVKKAVLAAMLVLFGILVLRRSWVAEDAFITFRTVDNFVNGYGLTWNTIERVQAYTHPLWMFLNSAVYAITHEMFYSSLFLSLAISVLTVWLFAMRLASSPVVAAFGILVLASSNAFVDYSTSGMENPLSHLLVVIFYIVFFRVSPSTNRVFGLSLLFALVGLTRLDLMLVCIPGWLFALVETPRRRKWLAAAAGLLPLVLWEVFSLLYYGFLFPNTAYAKLNAGIPSIDLARQGYAYLVNSLIFDPITLVLIASGVVISFALRNRKMMLSAAGILLYLLYVLRIGGDFMSGRFLTVPLLCAVLLICLVEYAHSSQALAVLPFVLVCLLNLASPLPTFALNDPRAPLDAIDSRGISDERRYYEWVVGFTSYTRLINYPLNHDQCMDGLRARTNGLAVIPKAAVGYFGFCAGPDVHVIDTMALADPLLSKLPVRLGEWRIGHFERDLPEGYLETVEGGENRLVDPDLARYYDQIKTIVSGRLWDWNRLVVIWKMNTRQYDPLLMGYHNQTTRCSLADIEEPKEVGTEWDAEGNLILMGEGVIVDLGEVRTAHKVEISVDNNDTYEMTFLKNGRAIDSIILAPKFTDIPGLRVDLVEVPKRAQRSGFNQIKVDVVSGDGLYSLGHLRLIER